MPAYLRSRFRQLASRLGESERPERLLADWFAVRAPKHSYRADPADLSELRRDDRLTLTGVSHPSSTLQSGHEVDAYVGPDDLPNLVNEWLLVDDASHRPNVTLRALPGRPSTVPLAMVAADLADHYGTRETAAARTLIRSLLS